MEDLRLTAKCADQAIHSTSAVYYVVKATARHGERAVIDKMATREQERSKTSYAEAVIVAATRHQEIMSLSKKGDEYKQMSKQLDSETRKNKLPSFAAAS